jgi:hypothetical protein
MPAPYDGGCICGAIRYRVGDEPLTIYACHCTDCQRHTGTSFALSMPVRRRTFTVVAGSPREYSVPVEGGHVRHGRFCAECGTRLWGEPLRLPDVIILRPGTLDDTRWVTPVAHIWTRSAQPWVSFGDGVQFETQPPDGKTLVELWRERHPR